MINLFLIDQYIKPKQIFMHLRTIAKERLYEDNSVESSNCCHNMHSVSVIVNQTKSSVSQDKSRSKSRQRGISLIHQSLSLEKLSNPKLKLNIVNNQHKFTPNVQQSMDHTYLQDNSVKVFKNKKQKLVEKCVNYKNNRIQQRDCFPKKQSYICPERPKRNEDDLSTCKNTPRIQRCQISSEIKAETLNKINICIINPQNTPKIDINVIQSKLDQYQKMIQYMRHRPATPSFEKLFEEHQGRKIVTIQSNQGPNSEGGDFNDYSVVESFVLGNRLS